MNGEKDQLLREEIIEAAAWITKFLESKTKEVFIDDELLSSGVMYKLQSVGEAVKRLSEDFKGTHPDIPWKNIAGMRDILVHDYTDVDRSAVWEAATTSIPELVEKLVSRP